jgi:uncharacterized protein YfaS (alpha-2-macroglobulin family)
MRVEVNGSMEHALLSLAADVEVRGVVRDPLGAPVPAVTVSLADANGQIVATAITGDDGSYRLAGLAGGEHTLVAAGYPPAATTVHVEDGKTTTVTVRLGPSSPGHASR